MKVRQRSRCTSGLATFWATRDGALLHGNTDGRAVFGPRSVVVLDVVDTEDFVQHEPRVSGTLTDPAVRDGVLAQIDAFGFVQLAQSSASERKVPSSLAALLHGIFAAVGMLTRTLRLLLRQVSQGKQLPEYSSGLRTSTRFSLPIAAVTSSRNARIAVFCSCAV